MGEEKSAVEREGPPRVRLVRCRSVLAAVRKVAHRAQPSDNTRIVVGIWPELPPVATLLDAAVRRLAEAALGLWPDWYGREPCDGAVAPASAIRRAPDDGAPMPVADVLPNWHAAASQQCRQGRLPLLDGIALSLQVAQLARALRPAQLSLVLAVTDETAAEDRLIGLARGAQWLAEHAEAPVLVLIPSTLPTGAALDSISFASETIGCESAVPELPSREKERFVVAPWRGRPHPDSAGEQLLAARLNASADLRGVFRFNEVVETCIGTRHVVDLLWPEGKVVVEVDGYYWHADPEAFQQDRQRDFELTISGYLTLRLAHDEVVAHVDRALDKIRALVAFRRQQRKLQDDVR